MLRRAKTAIAPNSYVNHFGPSSLKLARKGEGGGACPAALALSSRTGTTPYARAVATKRKLARRRRK
jgi:hypothetical protein